MVASGKLRINVAANFQTNGAINAIVSVSVNGAGAVIEWSFEEELGNFTTAASAVIATAFELDTAATPGQTVQVSFTSSAGDGSFSSFVLGTGDASANILLEEVP
jgi:hypothetical protein